MLHVSYYIESLSFYMLLLLISTIYVYVYGRDRGLSCVWERSKLGGRETERATPPPGEGDSVVCVPRNSTTVGKGWDESGAI